MQKDLTLPIAALCEGHQILLTHADLSQIQRAGHLAGKFLEVLDGNGILFADASDVYGSRPVAEEEEWQGRTLFVKQLDTNRVYILHMPSDQREVEYKAS